MSLPPVVHTTYSYCCQHQSMTELLVSLHILNVAHRYWSISSLHFLVPLWPLSNLPRFPASFQEVFNCRITQRIVSVLSLKSFSPPVPHFEVGCTYTLLHWFTSSFRQAWEMHRFHNSGFEICEVLRMAHHKHSTIICYHKHYSQICTLNIQLLLWLSKAPAMVTSPFNISCPSQLSIPIE